MTGSPGYPLKIAQGLTVRTAVLLVVVSIGAGLWLLRLTEKGIGVGSDSAVYIAGGENLLSGKGFVWFGGDQAPRPINHYPPLYSSALSLWLRVLPSADQAARGFNAVLMGANTFLVGLLAGLLSASGAAAVLGALLFAVSEEALSVHSWAMSDALYLFFALVCVLGAVRAVLQGGHKSDRLLMWGGASLGFLTRYVGISLMAIPLAASLVTGEARRARARAAAAGLGAALLPGALWLARNYYLTGSLTNRRLGFYPQDPSLWQESLHVVESWFVPGRALNAVAAWNIPAGAVLAVGALLLLAIGFQFRTTLAGRRPEQRRAWLLAFLLIPSHLAVVFLATWFSYPGPDVDTRNLAPVFAGSMALLAASLGVAGVAGSKTVRIAALVVAVLFLFFKAYASRDLVERLSRDGQGYTSAVWERSEVVIALQRLDPPLAYADDIGAVYYFTGAYAYGLPLRYDPITRQELASYHADYCLMRRRLTEAGAVLVQFGMSNVLAESAARADILDGLVVLVGGPGSGIFIDAIGPPPACEESRPVGASPRRIAAYRDS
jgi:4-amino-4-deoxy-L-arabinose transferase-like glycosyltransferase